jgi:hypothetical protein
VGGDFPVVAGPALVLVAVLTLPSFKSDIRRPLSAVLEARRRAQEPTHPDRAAYLACQQREVSVPGRPTIERVSVVSGPATPGWVAQFASERRTQVDGR